MTIPRVVVYFNFTPRITIVGPSVNHLSADEAESFAYKLLSAVAELKGGENDPRKEGNNAESKSDSFQSHT